MKDWEGLLSKKKRIRETPNLLTYADRSTNIFFLKKRKEKNSIWNDTPFLRPYESVNKCTSPLVEHLPRVDNPYMQSRTTPCF